MNFDSWPVKAVGDQRANRTRLTAWSMTANQCLKKYWFYLSQYKDEKTYALAHIWYDLYLQKTGKPPLFTGHKP